MQMELPHPRSGKVPSVKNPINFAQTPLAYERAPPTLGQHSDEVLRELGLSDADIDKLRTGGII